MEVSEWPCNGFVCGLWEAVLGEDGALSGEPVELCPQVFTLLGSYLGGLVVWGG
jgi:hypothetical protein